MTFELNKTATAALQAFSEAQHEGRIPGFGMAEMAEAIRAPVAVLKARRHRGQVRCYSEREGRNRADVGFSVCYVLENTLIDEMMAFGVSPGATEPFDASKEGDTGYMLADGAVQIATSAAAWAFRHLLSILPSPFIRKATLCVRRQREGAGWEFRLCDIVDNRLDDRDLSIPNLEGATTLVLPLGEIVVRVALQLYIRSAPADVARAILAEGGR